MGGDIKGTNVLEAFVCMNVERSGFESTFCTTAFISSVILNLEIFSKSSSAELEFKGTEEVALDLLERLSFWLFTVIKGGTEGLVNGLLLLLLEPEL